MASPNASLIEDFQGTHSLVIGGLGFLGSNLTRKLVELGSDVVILDRDRSKIDNIRGIENSVHILEGDIRDADMLSSSIHGFDYIFSLAASVSYVESIRHPLQDLEVNCVGHLNILEAARRYNPEAKILFPSSRLVYGKILQKKVSERHPTDPLSIYGAHKLTAEKYYTIYHKAHNLQTVVARIPNPYGPRQHIRTMQHGAIVGWIMKEFMDGHEVRIFGDGSQKRNYIYCDDIIRAFLLLISHSVALKGEIFNVGTHEVKSFREMVETVHDVVQNGQYRTVSWPDDFEKNETGDYIPDISKIERVTGFQACVPLNEGVRKMVEFYTQHKKCYW